MAAVPANVGLNVPRLFDVTACVPAPAAARCGTAAAGPPVATRSITGSDSSDSSTAIL